MDVRALGGVRWLMGVRAQWKARGSWPTSWGAGGARAGRPYRDPRLTGCSTTPSHRWAAPATRPARPVRSYPPPPLLPPLFSLSPPTPLPLLPPPLSPPLPFRPCPALAHSVSPPSPLSCPPLLPSLILSLGAASLGPSRAVATPRERPRRHFPPPPLPVSPARAVVCDPRTETPPPGRPPLPVCLMPHVPSRPPVSHRITDARDRPSDLHRLQTNPDRPPRLAPPPEPPRPLCGSAWQSHPSSAPHPSVCSAPPNPSDARLTRIHRQGRPTTHAYKHRLRD